MAHIKENWAIEVIFSVC